MFPVLAIAWTLALASTALAQARDETWKRCRGNDPDARLSACTLLIESGRETDDELASAYYARGAAYRQKSLFKLALEDFNAAIAANPALTDAYGDRGITLTILGRYAEAIPDYSRVIEAFPKLAYAYYNRGLCYELIGLDDLAIEDITASIDIEPRAEYRYERRGSIYFRKSQFDKALADYEEAIVINPQYAPALYGRGIIRVKNGDLAGGGADVALAKRHRATIAEEMERAGVK
jgi:tetratricopeptide (TPR) repeat protein